MNQTQQSAIKWINTVIAERGIKQTHQLLIYNLTKNPYFRESNEWITAAWARLSELNNS